HPLNMPQVYRKCHPIRRFGAEKSAKPGQRMSCRRPRPVLREPPSRQLRVSRGKPNNYLGSFLIPAPPLPPTIPAPISRLLPFHRASDHADHAFAEFGLDGFEEIGVGGD